MVKHRFKVSVKHRLVSVCFYMRDIRLTLKFGEQFHIKLRQLIWKLQNMQALAQKSFAVIANMTDNLYKDRTEKDEKVIS